MAKNHEGRKERCCCRPAFRWQLSALVIILSRYVFGFPDGNGERESERRTERWNKTRRSRGGIRGEWQFKTARRRARLIVSRLWAPPETRLPRIFHWAGQCSEMKKPYSEADDERSRAREDKWADEKWRNFHGDIPPTVDERIPRGSLAVSIAGLPLATSAPT